MDKRYEIYQRLHESKAVYLIRDIETNEFLVKKIYKYHDGMIYSRLLGLNIPGIPKVVAYEQINDEQVCVIEEYIKGSNLADYISEHGAMTASTAIDYGIRLCNILSELHKLTPAIIHRDIKPSNILLSEDGKLWLIDFNAAKEFHDDKTSDTYYIGTKDFAAPEQFGFGYSDERTDIYGLGKTLLYLINGGYSKQIPENIPSRLRNVIIKSTYTDTDRRYSNIIKMRQALESKPMPIIFGIAGTCAFIALLCFGISSLIKHNDAPTGLESSSMISTEFSTENTTVANSTQESSSTDTVTETSATQATTQVSVTQTVTVTPTQAPVSQAATITTTQATATQPTTQVPTQPPATQASTVSTTQATTNSTQESTRYSTNPESIPIYNGEWE